MIYSLVTDFEIYLIWPKNLRVHRGLIRSRVFGNFTISYSKQACGDDLLGGHLCSVRNYNEKLKKMKYTIKKGGRN
ncbi:hypothetical protein BpHYR1_030371 [Brachionus plicatilis]|uniref:Uncharacterized protein n=1 Tax=Brachionus plicatilis TaxID=10195 RepID=A0A3M7SYD4_BRAPC|nr:hypothetical protein BpHYR1_030371 [Brachionus plicatilis]